VVTSSATSIIGTTIVNASCPQGSFAVSGGYSVNGVSITEPVVGQSFPIGGSGTTPPTGWQATAFVGSGTLTTYVVCNR
jgi:hypothetical protein